MSPSLPQMKQQAVELLQQGRFDAARTLLQRICNRPPVTAESWMQLGAVNGQLGDLGAAIEALEKALRLQPDDLSILANLANALSMCDRTEEAMTHLRHAQRLAPDEPSVSATLGGLQQRLGHYRAALDSYASVLAVQPENVTVLNNRGSVLHALGQDAAALGSYQDAVRLKPDYAAAWTNLGRLQFRLGRMDDALAALARAVEIDPGQADAWIYLGHTWSERGRLSESAQCYARAWQLRPGDTMLAYNYSYALTQLGRIDAASECLEQVYAAHPDDPSVVAGLAGVLLAQGDERGAFRLLLPKMQGGDVELPLARSFALLCHKFDACDLAVERIEQLRAAPELRRSERRMADFSLGQLYDRMGDYDRAFECYRRANADKPVDFDIARVKAGIDDLCSVFSADRLAAMGGSGHASARPIFIVGMPRSGTSLVEQILASHPGVEGAGELNYINDLVHELPELLGNNVPWPHAVMTIDAEGLNTLAEAYLQRLPEVGAGIRHVTDKMPGNFMNLGLIQMLFPAARIVHCRRHPLDTCLSCYFQDFVGAHQYSYSLRDLGQYYQQYDRLMAHWRATLTVPMLELCYEDLVADQQAGSRRLLAFAGLDWDDACLSFHQAKRDVLTASQQQVRQPIYTKSVYRYRNYQSYLGPLEQALGASLAYP